MIRASQLLVLQTYGFSKIHSSAGTEFLHSHQAWRSYDSSYEGELEDPVTSDAETEMLTNGLRSRLADEGLKGKALEQAISLYLNVYKSEQMHSKATFRSDDQIDMFKMVEQPLWEDMMDHEIPLTIGTGNHFKAGNTKNDEATLIKNLFAKQYDWSGMIEVLPAQGQSFTYRPFHLPGIERDINAVLAHKMWNGNTEISMLSRQAIGTREDATIFYVGDRHHPGAVFELEKFMVLDVGKQATMDFVSMIGKVSSPRGSVVASYSPLGHQLYSTRFFLDNITENTIGWDTRKEILRKCYEVIDAAKKEFVKTV
jgi:hypothetical protein